MVQELTVPMETGWHTFLLEPGNYIFILRGGNDGRGGDTIRSNGIVDMSGGNGAEGQEIIWRVRILATKQFQAALGGDGADGQRGNIGVYSAGNTDTVRITGGGGGSSGGDTVLRFIDDLGME